MPTDVYCNSQNSENLATASVFSTGGLGLGAWRNESQHLPMTECDAATKNDAYEKL